MSKTKNFKIENLLAIIFGIIGIIFLIASTQIYFFGSIPKDKRVKTTATIIDIDPRQGTLVSYFINDFHYTNYLHNNSSNDYIGKTITLYYDKTNPNNIMNVTNQIVVYIFASIGVVFIMIPIIIWGFKYRKKKIILRLKESGITINAKIKDVKHNVNYQVNGRSPYNIICEWQGMDGKTHIFKSENIWFDPSSIIILKAYQYMLIIITIKNII